MKCSYNEYKQEHFRFLNNTGDAGSLKQQVDWTEQ